MIDTSPLHTLFWLLVAHAVCDYPLQGDFMAKAKNPVAPIPGVPWWIVMAAHCLIHAGGVVLVTGNTWLGLVEFVWHFGIDSAKCRGRISFADDQQLHVLCKVALWMAWWTLT